MLINNDGLHAASSIVIFQSLWFLFAQALFKPWTSISFRRSKPHHPIILNANAHLFQTQSTPMAPVASSNGGFNGFDFGSSFGASPSLGGAAPLQPVSGQAQRPQAKTLDLGGGAPTPKVNAGYIVFKVVLGQGQEQEQVTGNSYKSLYCRLETVLLAWTSSWTSRSAPALRPRSPRRLIRWWVEETEWAPILALFTTLSPPREIQSTLFPVHRISSDMFFFSYHSCQVKPTTIRSPLLFVYLDYLSIHL